MLMWISVVGVLARIQLLRVISCWYVSCGDQQRALRNFEVTMFCVQEPAVGSSSNADVDFSRWCISVYPAVASDPLLVTDLCCSDLIVAAMCGNYSSEAGFPGFAAGRGYDPAGGALGGG
ncbi:hypothetical protein F511_14794 [Dorcoceras hygrometricum]|uniref:Secreted protein n=1 Tax=Dorcoceras hygrometricum TaxID=472368 RepID=A0A2Z7BQ20_9LAMI|nr:hypothetical protein F511_14794 [Dorcoceras hygrometricum]